MAQSHIYDQTISRADLALDTPEDVTDAIDVWLRACPSREYKIRTTEIGHVCVLYDRGNVVATGRGAGSVNAMAHALEEYAAK